MTTRKSLSTDLIDSLLADYKKLEDLIGEHGLLKQLTKALVERALQAEMTEHLGHDKHGTAANPTGNARNGKSRKTLKGEFGELPIEIPRDRESSFEPQIISKHQTRWVDFDDKIFSLYARGMTVREIQQHLTEMYDAEVSPTLISTVTDGVMDEVKQWQSRPLDAVYPVVYLDCIHAKVRDAGSVRAKAIYESPRVLWRLFGLSNIGRIRVGKLPVVLCLSFCRRYIADRSQQTMVIEPEYPV